MKQQKKNLVKNSQGKDNYNREKFLQLYDSDFDTPVSDKPSSLFTFYKNIKINNEEKKKSISKICCTKNFLFISTSSVFSQVRIFNYNNLVNARREDETGMNNLSNIGERKEEETRCEERIEAENEDRTEGVADYIGDKTLISLYDVYNKNQFFNDMSESDSNTLNVEMVKKMVTRNFCQEKKKHFNRRSYSNVKNMQHCDTHERSDQEVTIEGESNSTVFLIREGMQQEHMSPSCCYNRDNKPPNTCVHAGLCSNNDTGFKEEYLYYDKFAGIPKRKSGKELIMINKEKVEEEKVRKEKEEELKKKKKIEEESIRNEELQKNGCYVNNNLLEINVDVIKRKTVQVNNLLEYIGAFINISSPILLMKKNTRENILSLLTYSGCVYSYDISETSLNKLKEKRIKKIELFNNIENYFLQQEKNGLSGESLEENDGEEATVSPLSVCNSYFTNSIKSFDFLSDDKTLVCVGLNKDYFLSFIDCHSGKRIIYNKKIKIKKCINNVQSSSSMNTSTAHLSLIYDLNYVHVEKEKKIFNGEMGNFIYIGSSCGYLLFIFVSEKFLQCINCLLTSDQVRNGSLFIYDPNADYALSKTLLECVIGNVDDVYKINKDELYALFDDDYNSAYTNKNSVSFGNPKESIFKNVEQNLFSYALYISKKVKINSIISINTNKNQNIHLLVALNDGRLLNFIFHICPFFSPNTAITNMNSNVTHLHKKCSEKSSDQKELRNGKDCNNHSAIVSDTSEVNFIKKSEKLTYDFTGLHKLTSITKMNMYQSNFNSNFIFINSNIKKIREMSDKNFYTTYMLDMCNKKIHILYQHLFYIIDSCVSSYFYFCLDDNNTVAVFSSPRDA
ncbi:conserved Plasmodium protein, unknown function [Plasmodium ovale wallikeri]|uniref:Uncharacterized protein n=2 Tax=Plasmodium ovale TaxID=36330 RepID=A0A1A8ZFR0_PLAOA|nr:conserved Plasmodium protein, unknown function [Plasmodium ovale wallikeri]SBT43321.1 conserved Plasmodium protein, unknown function [Plasmodium ovale wallikeri]SBT78406.1 conserved Plasmodium protein, unknown function [Plasmodium ovale]